MSSALLASGIRTGTRWKGCRREQSLEEKNKLETEKEGAKVVVVFYREALVCTSFVNWNSTSVRCLSWIMFRRHVANLGSRQERGEGAGEESESGEVRKRGTEALPGKLPVGRAGRPDPRRRLRRRRPRKPGKSLPQVAIEAAAADAAQHNSVCSECPV